MTRIDLRDADLNTIHELVGGGHTGDFAITFEGASVIIDRRQTRAIYELLANEFADEFKEPDIIPLPRKAKP